MRTFPKFLALPALPFDRIMAQLSLVEKFELAHCSKTAYKLVRKSINLKTSRSIALDFDYYSEFFSCGVKNKKDYNDAVWFEPFSEQEALFTGEEFRERRVAGQLVRVNKNGTGFDVIIEDEYIFQFLQIFTNYLLELFRIDDSNITLCVDLLDEAYPPILPQFTDWEEVHDAGTVIINIGLMWSCHFLELVNRFYKHSQKKTKRSFEYKGSIRNPENLDAKDFPPFDEFSTSSTDLHCPRILNDLVARAIYFTPRERSYQWNPLDYNSFIKKWLDDVEFHRSLEVLKLNEASVGGLLADYDRIVEGIPLIDFDGKRRPNEYDDSRFGIIDCTDGKDVIRSDGRIATVVRSYREMLLFIIWP